MGFGDTMRDTEDPFECVNCGYELPLDERVQMAMIDCPNCGTAPAT